MSAKSRAIVGVTRTTSQVKRNTLLIVIGMICLAVPAAAGSFDGTYTGERVLTAGDPATCVAKDPASATIQGDELTFTHSRVTDYTISVSPQADGAFVELSGNISGEVVDIRGHIGAGVLDADVTSAHCAHHWHLKKQH